MENLPNLLIVDDIEINLFLLEKVIGTSKVNLITALSGPLALEKTAGIELALAIIDVQMPEMNGFELATRLNETAGGKVPVIFLTANNIKDEDFFEGYNSGAVDYLSKPVSNHILLSKINVFLDLYNQKQKVINDARQLKEAAEALSVVNAALKKSEGRLRDIMFSMADWVWEIDENSLYTYSSQRGSELLGYSNEEILGKRPFDFMSPEEAIRVKTIFHDLISRKENIKDVENWNIGKNGEPICLLTNGVPIQDDEGNFKGYFGIDRDISKRRNAENALSDSEEKYRNYIDNAPEGVFVADESGRYLEVNEAACRITGYPAEELLSMSISDLLSQESLADGLFQFKQVATEGYGKAELLFRTKKGEKRWWAVSAVKLSESRFLGFTSDITLRKTIEEEFRNQQYELEVQNEELLLAKDIAQEARKKYTELYDFAPSAYLTLSPEQTILELNLNAASLLGKERSHLINENFGSYVVPDTIAVFKSLINAIFDTHTKQTGEFILLTTGNQKRHVHLEGLTAENGKLCLVSILDITVRKNIEEKLVQTSGRLSLAVRAGGIGVWDLNFVTKELLWDDRMHEIYGYKKDGFKHSYDSWLKAIHPEDLEQTRIEIQLAIEGEKEFDTEFRICWPDGSVHHIRANALVMRNQSNKPIRIIGTNWDMTEQKTLEENLKSSETNFRTFFETLDDLVVVGNNQGKIIYSNDAVTNKLGYPEEELLAMHILEMNPPELRAEAEQILIDMFARKRNSCPLPLIRKDGTKMPVETRAWFGKWNGNDCVFGLSKDLTIEQEALQKFNKIFENNPALMAITTIPHGIFTDVNDTFLEKTGYKREELIGKTAEDIGLFVEPKKQKEATIELSQNGFLNNLELQIVTKNGSILEGLFSGEIIEAQENNLFLTVMVDITDRKKAENLIRESEASLAEAQRIAHIGSWEWDMTENHVKWSKEMFRVFDMDPATYEGQPESILKVLHPDDIELFTHSMNNNKAEGNEPFLVYRVIHRDGSIHHLSAEGKMEFDPNGQPVKAIGTVQDITERILREKALHKANSFLDSIVENIPNMLFIKDASDLRFVQFNQAGEKLLGIDRKEIIGRNDYDFFPKVQADSFHEEDMNVLKNKIMVDIQTESIQTRDHKTRILHTKKVPILDEKGDPEYLLGISEDITERIQAEQTLKLNEEKYRTMLNASPDGIFLIDLNGVISDVSEIGIELFGFNNKEELIGKLFAEFITAEEKYTYDEIIERTINEGIAQNVEIRIRKKNQTLLVCEISSTFMQGINGKHFSFMIIIRDISQRKKSETKQIHADRMANLGEMASGMAHEINQPLNIISMVMDKVLFETNKTDKIDIEFLKNKADKIFENITRIRNIIDHVRAFSRSHNDYLLTAFDINLSIQNATSMMGEQFKHLGINLQLHLNKKIPQVIGNTYKFEQVIVNLLTNAKDALLEKNGRQEEDEMIVEINTYQKNQFLVVEFKDNGIGISNDDMHNIMLPFYTTKEEGKGTGLGLSICYQIIKEMDGNIEITSDGKSWTQIKLIFEVQHKA